MPISAVVGLLDQGQLATAILKLSLDNILDQITSSSSYRKMIKTNCVYDPVDLESDGFRVLVMRKWPRGIGYKKHSIHKWIKEVGPSKRITTQVE